VAMKEKSELNESYVVCFFHLRRDEYVNWF